MNGPLYKRGLCDTYRQVKVGQREKGELTADSHLEQLIGLLIISVLADSHAVKVVGPGHSPPCVCSALCRSLL